MTKKRRRDPFTQPLAGYSTFINQLYNAVFTNLVAWGIPPAVVAAFLAVLTPFNTAYAISKEASTSTRVNRATTRGTRAIANALARAFVKQWIFANANMTDAEIIACGLEPYAKAKSKATKPATVPDMFLKPLVSHNIKGFWRQPEEEPGVRKRGKPTGVKFVRVAYFVGKDVPAEPDQYGNFIDFYSTDGILSFLSSQTGQPVTIASCWVNSVGTQGDWCEPQTVTIP
jgi:hypothetical protein